ncbi:hypothetical protein V1524DRAFT_442911, partial [Lipomyces starkeyi]
MSDSDCEISTVTISDRLRHSNRIDYHLLNDGSDEEAGPEDRIAKNAEIATAKKPRV